MEVERLKVEGSEGVDVPIAVNGPNPEQNPDEVGDSDTRGF